MTQGLTTRDTVRTKQLILEGTGRALIATGPSVSLDAIATEAGVSKGGILHHFGTKEDLIRALAENVLTDFRDRVSRSVDLSENQPGKLLRAYVRVVTDEALGRDAPAMHPALWGVLGMIPDVTRMLQDDSRYWRNAFGADGLPLDRILIVWRAADGMVAASSYDDRVDPAEVRRLRDTLERLSYPEGAV